MLKRYPSQDKDYAIVCPNNPSSQQVYLIFDTVHLIKNIRNNLLAARFFQIPEFSHDFIHVPTGNVRWYHLHQVHSKDLEISGHL